MTFFPDFFGLTFYNFPGPAASLCDFVFDLFIFEEFFFMSKCFFVILGPSTGNVGLGKTVSHLIIGLKTAKGTKQLKLDPTIYEALQKEHVKEGDVIYIEANSGAVKRLGRSDAFATEFDLEAEEYVPLPKGDVHKRKEVIQDVTLHDLDVANARPQGM